MICYVKCICKTSDRLLVNKLRSDGYEIRNVKKNSQWRKEAKEYNMTMPFVVVDGIAKKVSYL